MISEPDMFKQGERVKHCKTGGIYRIMGVPNPYVVMEHCMEPFYQYWKIDAKERLTFCRPQSEMEDGRFVSAE